MSYTPSSLFKVGQIAAMAAAAAQGSWLKCDGSVVTASGYPALAAAMSVPADESYLRCSFGIPANTSPNAANYMYVDLTSVADYTLQSGDYLEYEVYLEDATSAAVDLIAAVGSTNLRDSAAVDQSGVSAHPANGNLLPYANKTWYARKIAIPVGLVGTTITKFDLACDPPETAEAARVHTARFRNICITDGAGTIRKNIWTVGDTVPSWLTDLTSHTYNWFSMALGQEHVNRPNSLSAWRFNMGMPLQVSSYESGLYYQDELKRWVIVGIGGAIATSTDGFTWRSIKTIGVTDTLDSVIYFKKSNLWVIGAEGGKLFLSRDLTDLAHRATLGAGGVTSIEYDPMGAGLLVATTTAGAIYTSTDALTWTVRTSPFGGSNIRRVLKRHNLWVAVGDSGKLATSPDGITWTLRTSNAGTDNLTTLTCGPTASGMLWVAGGTLGRIITSPDGITWTARSSEAFGTTVNINSIIPNPAGGFVALGINCIIARSEDGVTWTTCATASNAAGENIRRAETDGSRILVLSNSSMRGALVSFTTYDPQTQLLVPNVPPVDRVPHWIRAA